MGDRHGDVWSRGKSNWEKKREGMGKACTVRKYVRVKFCQILIASMLAL